MVKNSIKISCMLLLFLGAVHSVYADWPSWGDNFSLREHKLAVAGVCVIAGGLIIDKILDRYGRSKHASAVALYGEFNKSKNFTKEKWQILKAKNISCANLSQKSNGWGGFTPIYLVDNNRQDYWISNPKKSPILNPLIVGYKFWWQDECGVRITEEWTIEGRSNSGTVDDYFSKQKLKRELEKQLGNGVRQIIINKKIVPYQHFPIVKKGSVILGGALIGLNFWLTK